LIWFWLFSLVLMWWWNKGGNRELTYEVADCVKHADWLHDEADLATGWKVVRRRVFARPERYCTPTCRLSVRNETWGVRGGAWVLRSVIVVARVIARMWDTLHTAFDRSSGTPGTVGGSGWGRCSAWQRTVSGTIPWRCSQWRFHMTGIDWWRRSL